MNTTVTAASMVKTRKVLRKTMMFSISNAFTDMSVTGIVLPLPDTTEIEPLKRLFNATTQLYTDLNLSVDNGSISRAAVGILGKALDSVRQSNKNAVAFVVPVGESHPVFRATGAEARSMAFDLLMSHARESFYAGLTRMDVEHLIHMEETLGQRGKSVRPNVYISTLDVSVNMGPAGSNPKHFEYATTPRETRRMLTEEALAECVPQKTHDVMQDLKRKATGIQEDVSAYVKALFEGMVEVTHGTYGLTTDNALTRAVADVKNGGGALKSKLHQYPFDYAQDYPSESIQEHGGIPQNSTYGYVSNTFLDGLVNYGSNHVAYMVARYGLRDDEMPYFESRKQGTEQETVEFIRREYQSFVDKNTEGHHVSFNGDDWLVLYETSTSYFFMWYDQDCSDCSMERYSIETLKEQYGINSFSEFVYEALVDFLADRAKFCRRYTGLNDDIIVQPANRITGWLSS